MSVTGPKLSTAIVTGAIARKPKATRPNAKIGAREGELFRHERQEVGFCENRNEANISARMHQAHPERGEIAGDEAGQDVERRAAVVGGGGDFRTWRDLVLTKIFVNSMMSAPPRMPQAMMADSTHQRFGSGTSLQTPWIIRGTVKSPSNSLLATNHTTMETMEVIQTRSVSGASQLKSFLPP